MTPRRIRSGRVPRIRARFAIALFGRLTRLFGLVLLALCTLVPADVRARMAQACREVDDCCCRRAADQAEQALPSVRRVDCCEAPCELELTPTTATITAQRELAEPAVFTPLEVTAPAHGDATTSAAPQRGGRDPPQRIHALVEHWLV